MTASVCPAPAPAFFAAYIVEEKRLGVKGQLLVSGVPAYTYWTANFLFDMIPWILSFLAVPLESRTQK